MTQINISLFWTFLAVTKAGKISAASKILNLSQPAVTAQIRKLEEQLGVSLFRRSAKGVELTAEGEIFQERVSHILRMIDASVQEVSKSAPPKGHLSIVASQTVGSHILPPMIMDFAKKFDQVSFALAIVNTEAAIQRVRDGRDSFALVEGSSRAAGVATRRFFSDELLPVAAPAVAARIRNLATLKMHPILWREQGSGTRSVVEKALLKAGVSKKDLPVRFEFENPEAIVAGLQGGMGVGFLSRWSIQDELNSGRLRLIHLPELKIAREFSWVLPAGGLSGISLAFFEHVERVKVEKGFM